MPSWFRRSPLLPPCFAVLYGSCADEPEITAQEARPLWCCPQPWRTYGGHRTTHRSSNLTPFSTRVADDKDMKPFLHHSKTLQGSPRSSPARPAPCLIPTSRALYPTVFHPRFSHPRSRQPPPPLPCRLTPTSTPLLGLHSICIRTAFAAPPASFRRLFRTRAPPTFAPLHTTDQGRASEKVSTGYNGQTSDSPVGA